MANEIEYLDAKTQRRMVRNSKLKATASLIFGGLTTAATLAYHLDNPITDQTIAWGWDADLRGLGFLSGIYFIGMGIYNFGKARGLLDARKPEEKVLASSLEDRSSI